MYQRPDGSPAKLNPLAFTVARKGEKWIIYGGMGEVRDTAPNQSVANRKAEVFKGFWEKINGCSAEEAKSDQEASGDRPASAELFGGKKEAFDDLFRGKQMAAAAKLVPSKNPAVSAVHPTGAKSEPEKSASPQPAFSAWTGLGRMSQAAHVALTGKAPTAPLPASPASPGQKQLAPSRFWTGASQMRPALPSAAAPPGMPPSNPPGAAASPPPPPGGFNFGGAWMSAAAAASAGRPKQTPPNQNVGWMSVAAVAGAKLTKMFDDFSDVLRDATDATKKEADERRKMATEERRRIEQRRRQIGPRDERDRPPTPMSKFHQAAQKRMDAVWQPVRGLMGRVKDVAAGARKHVMASVMEKTGIPNFFRGVNKKWDVSFAQRQRRAAQQARAVRQGRRGMSDAVRGRVFDFKGGTKIPPIQVPRPGVAGAAGARGAAGGAARGMPGLLGLGARGAAAGAGALGGGGAAAGAGTGGLAAGGAMATAATVATGVGVAVAAVVAAGAAFMGLSYGMNAFGRKLAESVDHLRKYNGSIAISLSQLKMGDIRRDIQTARGNQMAIGANARATNRMGDALRPFDEFGSKLANYGSAMVQNGLANVFEGLGLSKFMDSVNKKMDEIAKAMGVQARNQQTPYKQFLGDLAQGKFGARKVPRVKSRS